MQPAPAASLFSRLDSDPAVRKFRLAYGIALAVLFVVILLVAGPPYLTPEVHTVNLYCFSGVEDAFRYGILPAFRARYEEKTGRRVELITTYAGSGYITQHIVGEFPADVAILSSEVDALYAARYGARRGGPLPGRGVVATSPLVIVVRPDNPRAVHGWTDLARDDVAVVHPDPTTSGAGVWSILAQYAAVQRQAGEQAAVDHLTRMRERVVAWPSSAAAAREQFVAGTGDALVTYRHEALADPQRAALAGEIVAPAPTMLTEHVAMKIARRGASPEQRQIVDALLDFLASDEASTILADYGLGRAVDAAALEEESRILGSELLTLDALGGASAARRDVLEGVWYAEIARRASSTDGPKR